MSIPIVPAEGFPRMARVRQAFEPAPAFDLDAVVEAGLERIPFRAGERIAITAGSRGIANLARTIRAVVTALKRRGAEPFIIPAMGSHGGATAEGQTSVLAEYGVSVDTTGVPVLASMEVERVGETEDGIPVYCSKVALGADGIVVLNRIKPHTDFGGPYGSGLLKMMAIGLGKQLGAGTVHKAAARLGLDRVITSVGRTVARHAPIRCGVGLVESALHDTALVEVIPSQDIEAREMALLERARALMARLPWEELDLLIVDAMGKDISGTGMDPNVVGRHVHGYDASLSHVPEYRPIIRRILVRDLTPGTHGNAVGLGLADFTTRRLTSKIDWQVTLMNALTSIAVQSVKTPITFDDDRQAIGAALASLALPDPARARVVRIASTLALQTFEASESCLGIPTAAPVERIAPPAAMRFDSEGTLLPA